MTVSMMMRENDTRYTDPKLNCLRFNETEQKKMEKRRRLKANDEKELQDKNKSGKKK